MEPVVKKNPNPQAAEAGFSGEEQDLILLKLQEELNLSCHEAVAGSAEICELEKM